LLDVWLNAGSAMRNQSMTMAAIGTINQRQLTSRIMDSRVVAVHGKQAQLS
jgi:phosphoribosyl-dephospho-CoA transferase